MHFQLKFVVEAVKKKYLVVVAAGPEYDIAAPGYLQGMA